MTRWFPQRLTPTKPPVLKEAVVKPLSFAEQVAEKQFPVGTTADPSPLKRFGMTKHSLLRRS